MSNLPENRRKDIWQMLYALDCFQNVEKVCEHILERNIVNGNPMYHSLLTAAYVIYGRPFKKNYGIGKLDESFVPKSLIDKHKEIIKHRDKIFSHTDVNGKWEEEDLSLNQVELVVENGRCQWRIRAIQAEPEFVRSMMDLSKDLARKADARIQDLNQRIGKYVPKRNGVYKLNLDKELKAFELTESF